MSSFVQGFTRLTWDVSQVKSFDFKTDQGQTYDVLIDLQGEGEANIHCDVAQNSVLNLFYLNVGQALKLNERYQVQSQASFKLTYADFNEAALDRTSEVILQGEGARVHLKSAILVQSKKELNYRFSHQAAFTQGDMENFAVTMKDGSMNLHAIGHIAKQAPNSETHQTTRVLNYNSSQRASVYPQLIIDNNDVKASHAQSSGQIDPEQLYYLQTRGLSQGDAVRLMIQGYLTSILEGIKDEPLKTSLLASIEKKVDEVCSM